LLVTLLKTFLLPPALQLVMVLLSAIFWSRYRFGSRLLMFLAWSSLFFLSLPIVGASLFSWLEKPYLEFMKEGDGSIPSSSRGSTLSASGFAASNVLSPLPQAVVVLGGGRIRQAPEYHGRDQVNSHSFWR